MTTKELTCIGCPMGCLITVQMDKGEVISVEGNTCQKGDIYARKEVTDPTRIVTSTVVIKEGDKPRLPVKTKSDIPKEKMFATTSHIMLAVGVRFALGVVYAAENEQDRTEEYELVKKMLMREYMTEEKK